MDSPVGPLLAAGDAAGLRLLSFPEGSRAVAPDPGWRRDDAAFDDLRAQFAAYFAGTLRSFDLPLAPRGTDFRRRVWALLSAIPYGETRSYGQIARALGDPGASRAVGAANGANPLPIIVPCHRVIGANGALTGFGGGLPVKTFLLEHEARVAGGLNGQPSLL
nr:methylated-DNA--[protein]-cysteine S-methyltransferase [Kandeliimicrobium roseum]